MKWGIAVKRDRDEETVAGCLTAITIIAAFCFIVLLLISGATVDGSAAETPDASESDAVLQEAPSAVLAEEPVVRIVESRAVEPEEVFEEPQPYYPLTEAERDALAVVLMCETGGVDELAAELVATCVLNACEKDGLRPVEVFERYQYAVKEKTPNSVCYGAVQSVFDEGNRASEECILWFYSPANMPDGVSRWHETQDFVLEYGGHRYFKAKEK